jgi:hypothetical protein
MKASLFLLHYRSIRIKLNENTGSFGMARGKFLKVLDYWENTGLVIKVLMNLGRIWKKEDKTGGFFYTFGTVLDSGRGSQLKSCTESENAKPAFLPETQNDLVRKLGSDAHGERVFILLIQYIYETKKFTHLFGLKFVCGGRFQSSSKSPGTSWVDADTGSSPHGVLVSISGGE